MATAPSRSPSPAEQLAWHFAHHAHGVWDQFTTDQQRQMLDEDLTAGKRVSLMLAALVTAGMLLAALSLLIILATG